MCTGWQPKKRGADCSRHAPTCYIFFKTPDFKVQNRLFQKRNARLTKWSGKPGEITDAFSIFSTSFKNVEKTERFLNLNNKASQFSIFNLSAFCIRNMSGTIFSAGYFFTPLGEKWAVKLSGSQRYQLIGRTYQKIQRNRYGQQYPQKAGKIRRPAIRQDGGLSDSIRPNRDRGKLQFAHGCR